MEAPPLNIADLQWKASSSSFSAITHLPSCILMEILSRLPIKTVVACKSVCKSWFDLIKSSYFIELHQSTAPTELCLYRFHGEKIVKLYMGNFNFPDIKIHTSFDHPQFSVLFTIRSTDKLVFSNSCNGLLCFFGKLNKSAVIWNPITSEVLTFPEPESYKLDSFVCAYGLGFSRKCNRFKLLRLVGQKELGSGISESVISAEICTIENVCSWRTLSPSPYPSERFRSNSKDIFWDMKSCNLQAIFLEGVLHWVVGSNRHTDAAIFCFDFEDDKFGEVPLPPQLEKYGCVPGVGVLEGCLCIADMRKHGVDIWLMREYGVEDSWTKVHSLELAKVERFKYRCCVPVTYLDNGEILMTRTYYRLATGITVVFSYNPVLKSVTVLGSGRDEHGVIAYKPTLATLKDSMMGCEVHVRPRPRFRTPVVERTEITTPGGRVYWLLMRRQQRFEEECQQECALLKKQIQQTVTLKKLIEQFEDRLRNGQTKVEQLKAQIQQSEAETARPTEDVANDGQE